MINIRVKKVGSKFNSNSIDSHEKILASCIEAGSERLNTLNQRLKKFQSKSNIEEKTQRCIEWVRQHNNYNEEIFSVSKSIKNILASPQSIKELGLDVTEDKRDDNAVVKEKTTRIISTLATLRSKDEIVNILQSLRNEYNQEIECDNNNSAVLEKKILTCEEHMAWLSKESLSSLLYQLLLDLDKIQRLCRCAVQVNLMGENENEDNMNTICKIFNDTKMKLCKTQIIKASDKTSDHLDEHLTTIKENTVDLESNKKGVESNSSILSKIESHFESIRPIIMDFIDRRYCLLDMKAEVDLIIGKLHSVSMHVIEQTWKCSAISAIESMEKERQYRVTLLRRIQTLTDEIKQEQYVISSNLKTDREKIVEYKKQKQRRKKKNSLDVYQNMKQALQQEQRKERKILLMREEEQRKERLAKNSKRVQFRREEHAHREKSYNLTKEREAAKTARKLRRLESLKSKVPYHSSILSMKSDLTKSTMARMNDIFEPACDTELLDFQQGMKKFTGFTEKRVFSDPKFRLAHALHESGTASSLYSIAVVKQIISREPDRISGDTSYNN